LDHGSAADVVQIGWGCGISPGLWHSAGVVAFCKMATPPCRGGMHLLEMNLYSLPLVYCIVKSLSDYHKIEPLEEAGCRLKSNTA
jgi:hypothetical protein